MAIRNGDGERPSLGRKDRNAVHQFVPRSGWPCWVQRFRIGRGSRRAPLSVA